MGFVTGFIIFILVANILLAGAIYAAYVAYKKTNIVLLALLLAWIIFAFYKLMVCVF